MSVVVSAPAPVEAPATVSSNVVLDNAASPGYIAHGLRMSRYISDKSAQDIEALDAEAV